MKAVAETRPATYDDRIVAVRRVAIVPALNEEETIVRVIEEIRAIDPGFEILVIDDGSMDRTAAEAERAGAIVARLPYNIGIGGAVQTGYQYARDNGFQVAVQIDGDGQHDPSELPKIMGPLLSDEADIVVGSRFAGAGAYRASVPRRFGIRIFRHFVSAFVGQSLTDTSSSFRAINRRALCLFAQEYPHGYLETVEATVLASRCGLRIKEVPVTVRPREVGRSTLTIPLSIFYALKVVVAVFVGTFRKSTFDAREDL